MTDIFFSYKGEDRERVRPFYDALTAEHFDVFWDQEVPAGSDWDSWIREKLAKSKCVVVFWSAASASSKNVRHEAIVANEMGKLIPVLLEPLRADQFPMGLYTTQAVNLADWEGDFAHEGWRRLNREVKARLIPAWVQQQISELEAELVAERARREGVERRDRALNAQIAKEVQAQEVLRQERNQFSDETAALKAKIDEVSRAQLESDTRYAGLLQRYNEVVE